MPQIQVNKWVQFAMSAAIVLSGALIAFDWTTLVSPTTAATIVSVLGLIKLVTNAIAPAAGVQTTPTGGGLITHKSDA